MKDRVLDSLGRVLLPKSIRLELNWNEGDRLILTPNPDTGELIIKKAVASCRKCNGTENLVALSSDLFYCKGCLSSLLSK